MNTVILVLLIFWPAVLTYITACYIWNHRGISHYSDKDTLLDYAMLTLAIVSVAGGIYLLNLELGYA